MRVVTVAAFIMIGSWGATDQACAADSCKACRAFQQACLKAHSKAACKTDYDICIKHCRKN